MRIIQEQVRVQRRVVLVDAPNILDPDVGGTFHPMFADVISNSAGNVIESVSVYGFEVYREEDLTLNTPLVQITRATDPAKIHPNLRDLFDISKFTS